MASASMINTMPIDAEAGRSHAQILAWQRPLVTTDPARVMLVITDRESTPTRMKAKA
jgi:hypothetical protein